jgi:hypothetical protein
MSISLTRGQNWNVIEWRYYTQETTQIPSPEKKVKIFETNAAAHKKQRESLPLRKR